MCSRPTISVLLPVYNAARYLPEALGSLADQTCRDFEVVAVNDGSTDESGKILDQFAAKNHWLRVLHQDKAGIGVALNRAFETSSGGLIARMDADDRADKQRLELQAEFLQRHSEIGVCGSWALAFGEGPEVVIRAPVTNDAIRAWLIFGSAFVHPAVMMRREVLSRLEAPYEVSAPPLEDYTLWLSLSGFTQFHNLPKVLLHYRRHQGQVTRSNKSVAGEKMTDLRMGLLSRLGMNYNAMEEQAHAILGFELVDRERLEPRAVAAWLKRLCDTIPAAGWCSETALRAESADAWWRYMRAGKGGPRQAWIYGRTPLAKRSLKTFFRMARPALR